MVLYNTGEFIKKLRIQKGLTQSELCKGIIGRPSLSKIERGEQEPKRETTNLLLQRLGFIPDQDESIYYGKKGAMVQQKMDMLDSLLRLNKIDEIDEMIVELENNEMFNNIHCRQIVLCAKASNALNKKEDYDGVFELLIEAIGITIPQFKEEDIPRYLLSNNELRIINMMANTYYYKNNIEKAIDIMYKLKKCVESEYMNMSYKGKNLPAIIYNLTRLLSEFKKYEEEVNLCDEAIDVCIRTNNYHILPLIILNKACSLYELGNIEDCKPLLLEAYYTCSAFKRNSTKNKIKDYVEKNNIDIVF